MKKINLLSLSFTLFLLLNLIPTQAFAKLRIAYVEGGHFQKYNQLLDSTAIALDKEKLIDSARIFLEKGYTSEDLWNWLATKAGGSYISFVKDAYYSASWHQEILEQKVSGLKQRIEEQNDIDLILTFGSAAALEVNRQIQNVNILAFALNDSNLSELSTQNQLFVNPHFFTPIEEGHIANSLKIFKDTIDFESLGICYEDTSRGRSDAGYREIKKAAKDLGFELVEGKIQQFTDSIEFNINARIQCHNEIAPQVDAIYLTNGLGNDYIKYTELLSPILRQKVPTFTQNGIADVEHGALFALSASTGEIATFQANTIKQLIEGKSFEEISREFKAKYIFALNLKMALEINWNLSFELLSSVDRIYREIKNARP